MSRKKQKAKRDIDKAACGSYAWMKNKMVLMNKTSVKTWWGVAILAFITGLVIATFSMANFETTMNSFAKDDLDHKAELEDVKNKIKDKKLKWEADETEISKLPKEERKKRMGAKEGSADAPDMETYSSSGSAELPTSFDWRNNNGNFVSAIRNQGGCGSCWAFAGTAALESAVLIKDNTPVSENPINLSEQIVLSCSGAGSCDGGYLSSTSSFLTSTGTSTELCFPYTASDSSCSNACTNWSENASKFTNYISVSKNLDSFKDAIMTYGPIAVRMVVYSDFYYYKTGVYQYASGDYQGGHYIVLIGYDDASQSFIAKNSWGTGWGQAGFFQIGYSEMNSVVGLGGQAYAYNTTLVPDDNTPPTVSISAPADGATVSGDVSVVASASDNRSVSKVDFYIDSVLKSSDSSTPYSFVWGTESYSEADHLVKAVAFDAAGNNASSEITVTVKNLVNCGDGTCGGVAEGEDCHTCPQDCGSSTIGGGDCSDCFKGICDGSCHPKKDGPNCPDCLGSSCCGDGVCSADEDCPVDCSCSSSSECDDGISCTIDTCNTTGVCENNWPECSMVSDRCCAGFCDSTTDADCVSNDCSDCFKGICDGSCHPTKDGPNCPDCK